DLVVEVLSSSTQRTDRIEKFSEYARAGVREYWLIDPEERNVEVYSLRGDRYTLLGKYDPSQTATSKLLQGFYVKVGELFLS
ncbi:MAG: Uma2 family endonuclease, partial [Deltaproteobacteria bacterium]|nr:Uma2 family endonuclease [Deltaproteobacteria bacterium]